MLSAQWGLHKEPSFQREGLVVRVKLSAEPEEEEWQILVERVAEETGAKLERE